MRLINAVREWNAEGRPPLRTIALHTAADRRAMFVREADEALLIGPDPDAASADGRVDLAGPNPYLDLPGLARALRACRAEAVWPGWGFVSENPEFARLCGELGIVFVGPTPDVMRALGDKIGSKLLAAQVGVPMAPWSGGPVADLAAARAHAEEIGYPLMVKATAGGGGRGIRLVNRPEELDEAFTRAAAEGARTAGDATVFLERALRGGRHVEVQVVADATGDGLDAGRARLQRAAAQPEGDRGVGLPRARRRAGGAAARVRGPAGHARRATSTPAPSSSSTSRATQLLSFLEVNTRLQVEHPVTEATTGLDIVKLQLHVAMGGRLADFATAAPAPYGHAIEARLTRRGPRAPLRARPRRDRAPRAARRPGRAGRHRACAAGDAIPPQFDSMIAKIIAWGRDRDEARARLARALRQTSVVIDGGTTNKAFLLDVLDRPEVRDGDGRHRLAGPAGRRAATGRRTGWTSRCWPSPSRRRTRTRRGSASSCSPRPGGAAPRSGTRRGTRSTCARAARPTGCGWPRPGATGTGWSSRASPWTSPRTGSTGSSARLDGREPGRDVRGAGGAAGPGLPRGGRRRRAPDLRR